jgi:hypothetical protein
MIMSRSVSPPAKGVPMAFEEPEVETWDSLDRIPHPKIRAFA